jgi:D-beta-D-heptose 7-phosphate kinase/D-beta-D-heptose 1-phosphate adenosyltransferase|tara:strand:+ start:1707 stop:2015 length:309 start_codon:yes stop_codon:yes gene_type:complete
VEGRAQAVTNDCFYILHVSRVYYLQGACNRTDALIVGRNSYRSVYELKGPNRSILTEEECAIVLAALESVDGVLIFDGFHAINFLRKAMEALPFEERARRLR